MTRLAPLVLAASFALPACRPEPRFDPDVYRDPQGRFSIRHEGRFSVESLDEEMLRVVEMSSGLTVRVVIDDQTKWVKRDGKWPAEEEGRPPVSFEQFASAQLAAECFAEGEGCSVVCSDQGRAALPNDHDLPAVEVRFAEKTAGEACGERAGLRELAFSAAVDVSGRKNSLVLFFRPVVPGSEPPVFLDKASLKDEQLIALRRLVAGVKAR